MAQIEMVVQEIRSSQLDYQHVLILKEMKGHRILPVWISKDSRDSINDKLQGKALSIFRTEDFACSIIDALGIKIMRAVIKKLETKVYYAEIHIECNGKMVEIGCRCSDAISVAIRKKVPIFADEKVLNE